MEGGSSIGARLAGGDEQALEDAYAVYGPSLLSYLRRFVGPDEAEDTLQRTFIEVWGSAKRYDPSRRFESWLFTIAHRRAVDCLRQRRHSVVDVDTLRDLVGEDGRETLERHADAAEVRAALHQLPDHERVVLEQAYFGDLSQPEIAARLQLPLGTVKARAARGTRRLAGILRQLRDEGVRDDRSV
ncbi:sigma-70 family RNA polymerase sigma factor [Nocardioides dongxiaopingii]|uniref:RNA polymerase sigma factor n=1 Tax=Nocardioides TaxID=1839 RepID=UPI0010C76696|nr:MULTISPECIES: sigma-70 family RNA polymerase sigma factor [Nocardioides]QCW49561.1 sigma-70 family RNA polymerase sigma factor [Nocardioides sp. S-1144]